MADGPELVDEDDALAPTTAEEASALSEKLDALRLRCDAAKIEFAQYTDDEDGEPTATISIQAGRAKRLVPVYYESRADALLAMEFEKYTFLSGYDAICCYKDGYIEAGLRTPRLSMQAIFSRLHGIRVGVGQDLTPIELEPPQSLSGRPTIEIGPCSNEFASLLGAPSSRVTLKLRGARATQHDHALAELRSYADSLFFQIDTLHGAVLLLERERSARLSLTTRRVAGIDLAYPSTHYNGEAMSLFWYAKSARDMPLLRFLAFYQSIEFYFPRYSQTEARRRVSSILKQPTFRPHRDDDVDRLISAIQSTRGGGIGSERTQLRAVVNECISADEIRQYLTAVKGGVEHFSGKGSKYHKIPLANRNADLRADVADRIYDIRCKIVHTKNEHSDDDLPMILPFSEDADYLLPDIDLAEFVARSVLVSASSELS